MANCRDCGARIEFVQSASPQGRVYWKPSNPDGTNHICSKSPSTNKNSLPSNPVSAVKADDGWKGDKWDQLANQHLLGYIVRRMNVAKYGPRSTAILIEYKNAWAQDMRESELDGSLPKDEGRADWISQMARCEEHIARERTAARAAKAA